MKRSKSSEVNKQSKMTDCISLSSPMRSQTESTASFIISPTLFRGNSKSEVSVSPTSTLDIKPFNPVGNPCGYGPNICKSPKTDAGNKHPWEKLDYEGIGLALITSQNDEYPVYPDENFSKPANRMVHFAQQLKVQIPHIPATVLSASELPSSPDFGIKTRAGLSPIPTKKSPQLFIDCLSVTEMELSEDYTCVISHGPNPKTTHIFDNCIVGSCDGVVGSPALRRECCLVKQNLTYASDNFLDNCYSCKKSLGHEKDIYIYRGEKAFCSQDCRNQEILQDEMDNKSTIG